MTSFHPQSHLPLHQTHLADSGQAGKNKESPESSLLSKYLPILDKLEKKLSVSTRIITLKSEAALVGKQLHTLLQKPDLTAEENSQAAALMLRKSGPQKIDRFQSYVLC
ncbi:MAG: hypothetical protein JSR46_04690 [Verrucomicrobia bacterium]|nr:hypothetical protein [Verrucomicrobiota bacterium]